MIRILLFSAVCLSASAVAAGQAKSGSWIKGNWEGTGYQIDDKSTWEMKFTAHGRRFSVEYPSLNCGGHWQLISISNTQARFREILDHGADKCANRGQVLIQKLSARQLVFLYLYERAREISASAVLNRKP